ncbi:MAG: hypothetical protein AAGK38_10475, partial [Pseudomonadota bacterium]
MLSSALSNTLSQLFAPRFRAVLWKSIGLTVVMLIGLWFALQAANEAFLLPYLAAWPWAATTVTWVLGAGLIIGLGFLLRHIVQKNTRKDRCNRRDE